jgi:hypothetical protein
MIKNIELKTFTKENLFKSPICYSCNIKDCNYVLYPFNKKFTQNEIKKVHNHNKKHYGNKSLFNCTDCPEQFEDFNLLKIHIKYHLKEEIKESMIRSENINKIKENIRIKKALSENENNKNKEYNIHPIYNDDFFILLCIRDFFNFLCN